MAEVEFKNPSVLHLMLAFAALHLAHCRPHRKDEYVALADHHYERALILVTPQIANINAANSDTVLVAVQSFCLVSWGRGPQPGEYLAFGREKKSDWLVMLRGVRTTSASIERPVHIGTNAPAAHGRVHPLVTPKVLEGYEKHLDDLREHVDVMSKDTPGYQDDLSAVDILREIYANRCQGSDGEYHVFFGWLYRVTDDFLERLQQRDPIPMIIYAYFVVLIRVLNNSGTCKGGRIIS